VPGSSRRRLFSQWVYRHVVRMRHDGLKSKQVATARQGLAPHVDKQSLQVGAPRIARRRVKSQQARFEGRI